MTRISRMITAVALATAVVTGPALAQEKMPTKVNGKLIPKNQVEFLIAGEKAQGRQDSPELRAQATEMVIRQQVLLQQAQKQGFDKKSDVQMRMELARQSVLINAYVENYMKQHPVSEDAVKKEYEALKQRQEYKVRHILVDSENEAKDIIAKLKKGEKMETLASASKDPGSKDKGGDLGWTDPATFVKPFAEALVKLNKGQYTEAPVKSDFGWHVILLEDTRSLKLPSYEEAKPQITQAMQQRVWGKHALELRQQAKLE